MTAVITKKALKSGFNGLQTADVAGEVLSVQFEETPTQGWVVYSFADPDEIPTPRRFAVIAETMPLPPPEVEAEAEVEPENPLPPTATKWDFLSVAPVVGHLATYVWFVFQERTTS